MHQGIRFRSLIVLGTCFYASVSLAEVPLKASDPLSTNAEDIAEQTGTAFESCQRLLKEFRNSECGQRYFSFLEGGNISIGFAVSSFTMEIQNKQTQKMLGKMGGDLDFSPHYSINTAPRFFDDSKFGYEYSFTYGQSASTKQEIDRPGFDEVKHLDLGTYAIGSLIAVQANLFYAFGGNDETPLEYFLVGFGIGAGYSSAHGRSYLTEDESNAACYNAGTDFMNGVAGAADQIKANCELSVYDKAGLGGSIRIQLTGRYKQFMAHLESSFGGIETGGGSDNTLIPGITSITFAYVMDVF